MMMEVLQKRGGQVFTKGAYYIGKMVWSKGYRELLQLLLEHQNKLSGIEVDLSGSGEDSDEVQQVAQRLKLIVRVFPGQDPADPLFDDTKELLKATFKALSEESTPLTDNQRYELSWEAATERFLRATDLNQRQMSFGK